MCSSSELKKAQCWTSFPIRPLIFIATISFYHRASFSCICTIACLWVCYMVFVVLITSKFGRAKSDDGVSLFLQFKLLSNSELRLAAVRFIRRVSCESGYLGGRVHATIYNDSGSLISLGYLSDSHRDSTRDRSAPLLL